MVKKEIATPGQLISEAAMLRVPDLLVNEQVQGYILRRIRYLVEAIPPSTESEQCGNPATLLSKALSANGAPDFEGLCANVALSVQKPHDAVRLYLMHAASWIAMLGACQWSYEQDPRSVPLLPMATLCLSDTSRRSLDKWVRGEYAGLGSVKLTHAHAALLAPRESRRAWADDLDRRFEAIGRMLPDLEWRVN